MAELTISASAGVLIRGQFRREIESYCFLRGYKVDVDEDKGFFESLYRITIHLPDEDVKKTKSELDYWLQQVNS